MPAIAILRGEKLPNFVTWDVGDVGELYEEDDSVVEGFRAQGWDASAIAWTDPSIEWSAFDAALIRSTWDYIDQPARFVKVLETIEAAGCQLFNPLPIVRWNFHKRYLLDLASWGAPVVPTVIISAHDADRMQSIPAKWDRVVVKPVTGLGGADVYQAQRGELDDHWAAGLLGDVIVQPFVESIPAEGEWSFVYLDGNFHYALLKTAGQDDFRVQGIYGGSVERRTASPDAIAQADNVMARLPFDPLYARIDMARFDGRLHVVELELIEPILYFNLVPEAIEPLVSALANRLE